MKSKATARPSARTHSRVWRATACIGMGLFIWNPALSQTAVTQPAADSQSAGAQELQEVVVTAQRRSENLQQVPISAVARSGDELVTEGVYNSQSLPNLTPSLSIQPSTTGATYVNIRGVGLQQTNPASSQGIAFYLDGVFEPQYNNGVDTFYDIGDVEVLRGPQGTLVGSNADGGAIFINSVKPSFDQVKGYVEQTVGRFADYRTEGAINLPISDMFAARVSFVRETENSFTSNVGEQPPTGVLPSNNNQPGNVDYSQGRIQLSFKPSDSFISTLRFEAYSSSNDGAASKPDMANFTAAKNPEFNAPAYDPYAAAIQNRPFVIDYNYPQYFSVQGSRIGLTSVWNITDAIEVKSVTGYSSAHEKDSDDIDQSSAPGNFTEVRANYYHTTTQEIDVLSTSNNPFQWVAGLYYFDSSDPLILTFNDPPPTPSVVADVTSKHRSEAGFVSGTYKFTDQWALALGARYSADQLPFDEFVCTGFPQPCGSYSTSDTKTTWSAKLTYQITPDTLVYASGSSGYKAGGVNLQIPDIGFTPPAFKPETNTVEEVGIKTTVLDNHLRLNLDGYNSNYNNYQIQQFLGGLPATQGPGKARIYGAEAEAIGVFDALRFDAGASYLHATVSQDFTYLQNFGPAVAVTSGTELPYAPKYQFNVGVQYSIPVYEGKLTPRLQYQYQASQYVIITHEALPGPDQELPSHGTLDGHLTYAMADRWSVEAYMSNITNKIYVATIQLSPQPTANGLLYGAPRQYGARLTYRF
jgi:iron complex outermembrane recepter protein